MDRATTKLEISGHSFTAKTYATARESQAIQQALFKGTKVEVTGQEPKITDFNPAVKFDLEGAMIEQMVVDMDGAAEDIKNRCLDLPSDIYTELIGQLDGLVSKKNK